jgi:hypothetical protein
MSFTYDFTNYPDIAVVRLLCFDTNAATPIFQDDEITASIQMNNSQYGVGSSTGIIVGLSGYSPATPPRFVISHRRAASTLLRSLGANAARQLVSTVLDVHLSGAQASAALSKIADQYIEDENTFGYFAVAEMVNDAFSMRERLWKQLYRLVT